MKKLLLSLFLCMLGLTMLHAQEKLTSGGIERQMIVYAPKNLGENRPLLISMHGASQGMDYQRDHAQFEAVADTAKFLVVYPNGIDKSWDLGSMKDINFILDIINAMYTKYKINKNRVYLSGFSMGGMMTYYAMNKIADKIAAFAPVSGYNMGGPSTNASRPIPILHVHGTADDVCTYSPVMNHVQAWAKFNGCNMTPVTQKPLSGPANTTAELIRYMGGKNGVEVAHLKLPDKGHWCSNDPVYAMSNIEIWNFCQRWSLTPGPEVKSIYPEDGSFDMLSDTHREFRITVDKALNVTSLAATLVKGATTIKLKASTKDDGKTLILSLPGTTKIPNGTWTLSVSNVESTDGGTSPTISATYVYGVEEVGDALKIDTLYHPDWLALRETIGEGIPQGWRCKVTDANDKTTIYKHTDSIPTGKTPHLLFFDDETSQWKTGFQLYPYKNKKVELYTYDSASRPTLRAGKVTIRFKTVYLNSKANTNKMPLVFSLTNVSDNSAVYQNGDIKPKNYMRTSSKVSNSNEQEFIATVSKSMRCNLSFSVAHEPATATYLDCILITEPLITTTPTQADVYKGGFLRTLKQAKALLANALEYSSEDNAADISALENAINEYEDFSSVQPSDYDAATKALEAAMKPVLAVGMKAVVLTSDASSAVYDLTGRRLSQPQRGINIIRTEGGKTRKVLSL